jgi:23S rRNA pseudouridine1911/1915/1917 synthase
MTNSEVLQRVVTEDQAGTRLDRLLGEWDPNHSRTVWSRQIHDGLVTVNQHPVKASYSVQGGDIVEIVVRAAEPEVTAFRREGPVEQDWILYQDDDLLVIDKPRNLVVHPSRGHHDDSVVHRLSPLLSLEGEDFRPGVVHRLDRDTTGLLVLARSERIRAKLSAMIQAREVHRDYLAVISGKLFPRAGVIEAPIGRDPDNRLKMAVIQSGRDARTHYRTLATWGSASLVQLTLETGRTHQIRVHLASVDHPVIGDSLYASKVINGSFHAQFLHAMRLAFPHPVTGQSLCFWHMPPDDWKELAGLTTDVTVVDPITFSMLDPCPQLDTAQVLIQGLGFDGS